MKKATKKTTKTPASETYEWLMAETRIGRRIEKLGWKHLARIYNANQPGSKIRKAINAEARRCGFIPRVVIGLHS